MICYTMPYKKIFFCGRNFFTLQSENILSISEHIINN